MGERTGQEEIFIAVDDERKRKSGRSANGSKSQTQAKNLGHFITKNLPFQGAANLTAVTKLS